MHAPFVMADASVASVWRYLVELVTSTFVVPAKPSISRVDPLRPVNLPDASEHSHLSGAAATLRLGDRARRRHGDRGEHQQAHARTRGVRLG